MKLGQRSEKYKAVTLVYSIRNLKKNNTNFTQCLPENKREGNTTQTQFIRPASFRQSYYNISFEEPIFLISIDAKILNKKISKLNRKYIKKIKDDNKIPDPSNSILLP